MTNPDNPPLTDAELDELNEFLLERAELENPMDVSMLDGYLTAIVCSSTTIMPNEWVSWVWDTESGEASPKFEDKPHARHIVDLIMRLMYEIEQTLKDESKQYEPLLLDAPDEDDPASILGEWCTGFMRGVYLDYAAWETMIAGKPDLFSTVIRYGTQEGYETIESRPPTPEEHRALAEALPASIMGIHALCAEERAKTGQQPSPVYVRHEPVRNPEKVGRNDPCPCGSGKKYKRCHGSQAE